MRSHPQPSVTPIHHTCPHAKMEFREWLGFLFGWIPLLGLLFPAKRRRRVPPSPPTDFPRARVAIIGAGVGGCSAAYFVPAVTFAHGSDKAEDTFTSIW